VQKLKQTYSQSDIVKKLNVSNDEAESIMELVSTIEIYKASSLFEQERYHSATNMLEICSKTGLVKNKSFENPINDFSQVEKTSERCQFIPLMLSCILSNPKMLNFWLAADEMENTMIINSDTKKTELIKFPSIKLNDLLGKKFYDVFPRSYKDSSGHTMVSSESNVVLNKEYVRKGSCSFKSYYGSKLRPTIQCATSCE
jgi:hypothetical protein